VQVALLVEAVVLRVVGLQVQVCQVCLVFL
jgi:hypothetical protein